MDPRRWPRLGLGLGIVVTDFDDFLRMLYMPVVRDLGRQFDSESYPGILTDTVEGERIRG